MKLLVTSLFLCLLCTVTLHAQDASFDYSKQWKAIAKLQKANKSKVAKALTYNVLDHANKDKDERQMVKAVIYILNFNELEENPDSFNFPLLHKEIAMAPPRAKAILQNLLAGKFVSKYGENRYDIEERAEVINQPNDSDYNTWDEARFKKEILHWALLSIADKDLLQKTPSTDFKGIIGGSSTDAQLKPTLYDILVQLTIGYLQDDEDNGLLTGADSIPVMPYNTFINWQIEKERWYKGDNFRLLVLKLYQDLEKFHANDKSPDALIDVDISRLNYIADHTENVNQNKELVAGYKALEDAFSGSPASAMAGFKRAEKLYAAVAEPGDHPKTATAIQVLEICNYYIGKYPNSPGGKNCALLRHSILKVEFSPSMSKFQLPSTTMKLHLRYSNMDKVFYRAVAITDDEITRENKKRMPGTDRLKKYLTLPVLQKGSFTLPKADDHETHNTNLALAGLDLGHYIIIASRHEDFGARNGTDYCDVVVTGLTAFLQKDLDSTRARFYVLDAANGASIPDADVTVHLTNYTRKDISIHGKTNASGYIKLDSFGSNNFYIKSYSITKDRDKLVMSDGFIGNYWPHYTKDSFIITKYFTDRAVYRPGQTVYFKGIILRTKNNNVFTHVIPNRKTTVALQDVNGTKIDSQTLTSNEFGSFSGSFKLPANTLNGQFSIEDNNGQAVFSVEEYKRPKFEVAFLKVHKTYKVNDSVEVEGYAVNYSGSNLDNAKVKYTVKAGDFNTFQIKEGTLTTDAKGHFKIRFKAVPFNREGFRPFAPYNSYTVEAIVTDITNETHNGFTGINIGAEAMTVNVHMDEWVNNANTLVVNPSAMDFNNSPVNTKGTMKIEKMVEPDFIGWSESDNTDDVYLYDSVQFHKQFPGEVFKKENQLTKVEKTVLELPVSANEPYKIDAATMKAWAQGHYRVTFSARDTFGNMVKTTENFKVFNPGETHCAINSPAYMVQVEKTAVAPGGKASFIWGSVVNATGHVVAVHNGRVVFEQNIKAEHNQKVIEIPVKASYLGGLRVSVFTSVQNHTSSESFDVSVFFPSKELNVQTSVFHSSLMPGQKESWKLKVKGPDAQKISAEIMATLYDASLDAIKTNEWYMAYLPYVYNNLSIEAIVNNGYTNFAYPFADESNQFLRARGNATYSWQFGDGRKAIGGGSFKDVVYYEMDANTEVAHAAYNRGSYGGFMATYSVKLEAKADSASRAMFITKDEKPPALKVLPQTPVVARKNLQELAFFYPQLKTNDSGEVEFSFTMPEALTQWRFMALAHTKDLMTGLISKYTVTQKQLMVQPNPSRFLREGDAINFSTKVSNMSNNAQDVTVTLTLNEASIDQKDLKNLLADEKTISQRVHIPAMESQAVSWSLKIPKGLDGFIYKITAANDKFSDGEEGMVPVLPARVLMTESMPLFVRGDQTKNFKFNDLLKYQNAATLAPYNVTMEMTSNPGWYAIKALPYLMEFPHECNEQLFERFFANTVASYIIQKEPKIKETFQKWQQNKSKVLQAQLEQNPDLKNILLAETPWVRDAQDENERNKRIADLFNDSLIRKNLNDALTKLEKSQLPDGSWSWFPGMKGDRYITSMICIGIGRLESMRIITDYTDRIRALGVKAFAYLDDQMLNDYNELVKRKVKMDEDHLTSDMVDYLYARTYWKVTMEVKYERPLYFWLKQSFEHWQGRNLMEKAMLVSALKREDEEPAARKIYNWIDDHALHSEEMGMYWKENIDGYGRHEEEIETQCMLIEAYNSLTYTNTQPLEEMKIWLLRHKQVHNWPTTKATADAVYVLLLKGRETVTGEKQVKLTMGGQTFDAQSTERPEAGTGYFTHSWKGSDISPKLGDIKIEKKDEGIAWGSVTFQYYQDLDKVKAFSGPVGIKKKVLVQSGSKSFEIYHPESGAGFKAGDLVKIRIEITLDRDMEYMHLKDLRGGAFEPVEQLSGYRYQQGLGYYQDIKDASINFFFDHIPKGTYVFEYDLHATQTGTFQNGIATMENMYAPEFKSHSDGVVVKVK